MPYAGQPSLGGRRGLAAERASRAPRAQLSLSHCVPGATGQTGLALGDAARAGANLVAQRGRGSVGRASPCQGEGRGFESRRPL